MLQRVDFPGIFLQSLRIFNLEHACGGSVYSVIHTAVGMLWLARVIVLEGCIERELQACIDKKDT